MLVLWLLDIVNRKKSLYHEPFKMSEGSSLKISYLFKWKLKPENSFIEFSLYVLNWIIVFGTKRIVFSVEIYKYQNYVRALYFLNSTNNMCFQAQILDHHFVQMLRKNICNQSVALSLATLWGALFIWKSKNCQRIPRDFNSVLDTINHYWIDPAK